MQTHKTFALLSKIYVLDFFLVCSFFPQDVTGVYITIILPQTMDKFVFSQTGKRYVDFVYLYLSCFILPHVIHIEETGISHRDYGNWVQVFFLQWSSSHRKPKIHTTNI